MEEDEVDVARDRDSNEAEAIGGLGDAVAWSKGIVWPLASEAHRGDMGEMGRGGNCGAESAV